MRRASREPSEWLKLLCNEWASQNEVVVNQTDEKFREYKSYLNGQLSSQLLCRLSILSNDADVVLSSQDKATQNKPLGFWSILGVKDEFDHNYIVAQVEKFCALYNIRGVNALMEEESLTRASTDHPEPEKDTTAQTTSSDTIKSADPIVSADTPTKDEMSPLDTAQSIVPELTESSKTLSLIIDTTTTPAAATPAAATTPAATTETTPPTTPTTPPATTTTTATETTTETTTVTSPSEKKAKTTSKQSEAKQTKNKSKDTEKGSGTRKYQKKNSLPLTVDERKDLQKREREANSLRKAAERAAREATREERRRKKVEARARREQLAKQTKEAAIRRAAELVQSNRVPIEITRGAAAATAAANAAVAASGLVAPKLQQPPKKTRSSIVVSTASDLHQIVTHSKNLWTKYNAIAREHNQKVNWITVAKELGMNVKVREKYARMHARAVKRSFDFMTCGHFKIKEHPEIFLVPIKKTPDETSSQSAVIVTETENKTDQKPDLVEPGIDTQPPIPEAVLDNNPTGVISEKTQARQQAKIIAAAAAAAIEEAKALNASEMLVGTVVAKQIQKTIENGEVPIAGTVESMDTSIMDEMRTDNTPPNGTTAT